MTPSSLANLPDGGVKLHSRLAILRNELASLEGTGELPAPEGNFSLDCIARPKHKSSIAAMDSCHQQVCITTWVHSQPTSGNRSWVSLEAVCLAARVVHLFLLPGLGPLFLSLCFAFAGLPIHWQRPTKSLKDKTGNQSRPCSQIEVENAFALLKINR